jgi:hypothetical protein
VPSLTVFIITLLISEVNIFFDLFLDFFRS